MKLTKQQLKQIVKEEMTTLMNEAGGAEKIRLDNPGFGGSWCEKWEEIQTNDPTMRLFEPEKWAAYKSECDQEQNRQWLRDIEVDQGIANPRGGSVRNPEAEKTWDRRWGAGTMRRTPDWRDVSENKLKLTKQQLKQIVKEEMVYIIAEITGFEPSPEMEVMKHYQALLDALEDSGRNEWADILSKLRPELEHDLDVEARGDEDVFTNAPKDYASMEEQKLTKQQFKQIVREELSRLLKDQYATELLPNGLLRVRDRRSGLVGLFNRDLTKHSGDLKVAKGKLKQILNKETAY